MLHRNVISFTAAPPPRLCTLSLHDALPISTPSGRRRSALLMRSVRSRTIWTVSAAADTVQMVRDRTRSEEHTSELQSRVDLVCRPLLEKKKTTQRRQADRL